MHENHVTNTTLAGLEVAYFLVLNHPLFCPWGSKMGARSGETFSLFAAIAFKFPRKPYTQPTSFRAVAAMKISADVTFTDLWVVH